MSGGCAVEISLVGPDVSKLGQYLVVLGQEAVDPVVEVREGSPDLGYVTSESLPAADRYAQ